MFRIYLGLFFTIFTVTTFGAPPSGFGAHARPKLVLLLVYDQFRSDYLTRFESQFLPPLKGKKTGGFRYLMEKGAYYPLAEYEVLQCMTCPGHAMIATGAYPSANGVSLNHWYDAKKGKSVSCVEDEKYGISPGQLRGSTFGDELKLVSPKSRVVSLALKDRPAVMMGGHGADAAFWFDAKKFQWTTSEYYSSRWSDRPKVERWVNTHNRELLKKTPKVIKWKSALKKHSFQHDFEPNSEEGLSTPYGGQITTDFALRALKEFQLGQRNETDVLAISFSTHDLAGHQFGPASEEMEALTLKEDEQLSDLFNTLNTGIVGGMGQVLVILTADHGVAPIVEDSQRIGLSAGLISEKRLAGLLSDTLDQKFNGGKVTAKPWIQSFQYLNIYPNRELIQEKGISEAEFFQTIRTTLRKEPGVSNIVSGKEELRRVQATGDRLAGQIERSFVGGKSGDYVLMPEPFWYEETKKKATHITGYSYDRYVPIIFAGYGIPSGKRPDSVRVVDIAPTISYLIGTVPPALSEGKVIPLAR